MRRRQVLIGIAAGVSLSAAPYSRAQRKVPLIGMLDAGERLAWWAAFRKQMHELGYIEGRNVAFETRFARGKFAELGGLAQDLLRQRPDIIVTAGTEASLAAARATDRIPIVTTTGGDQVSHGLAASLAQPGGNVTGMTSIASELTGKRFELLREIHPRLGRMAVLWQSDNSGSTTQMRDLQLLAGSAKVSLQNMGVRKADELPAADGTLA